MREQSKIILRNNRIGAVRTITLSSEMTRFLIGTSDMCDFYVPRNIFHDDFTICLKKENNAWKIDSSQNLEINRKGFIFNSLGDGENIEIFFKSTNSLAFEIEHIYCIDYTKFKYNRVVDLTSRLTLTLGTGTGNDISLRSNMLIEGERFSISKDGLGSYVLKKTNNIGSNFRYLIINGNKIDSNSMKLKNLDYFSIANFNFYIRNEELYFDKDDLMEVNIGYRDIVESVSAMNYPEFVRNSRLKLKINDEPFKILSPKEKPKKPKSNLVLKLLPALAMIFLSVFLRGFMGNSNISFILFSVCSMSIGAIVSTISIISGNKEYKQSVVDREISYRKYIDGKREEIKNIRSEELQFLNRIYYRYDEIASFAKSFSGSMFDRTPKDEDFLELRIGIGIVDAIRPIDYSVQEKYESDEDELLELPLQLSEEYSKIINAPICLQLKDANVIGIVSNDNYLYETMKILYFDLCMRHHYDDVQTILIIDKNEVEKYSWVKWFKHINCNDRFRNIACDDFSRNTVFEYLYNELSERENNKEKGNLPHIVVFVMCDYGIMQHPISRYIEKASEYGVTFIFFENYKEFIPLGCSQLVYIDSNVEGRVVKSESTKVIDFKYMSVPDEDLYMISHKLAPIYSNEVNLESSLTSSITFFEMLGITQTSEINLSYNWNSTNITKTLKAPIGVKSGNSLVYLDIKDGNNSHGPHGIVAGTTGSGKSELLMSYILSMAVFYSPYEVAFLIIDFKGGGMADNFKDLPHTLGLITNIDGNEINRSLISVHAEIERRQKVFKDATNKVGYVISNIDDYVKAYKKGLVSEAVPHLIIIVDEFAELKAQFNDFMEELKSAARIGRTLGVHLILATQRPEGQVDPQIESNSKFRLCLKVQTPEDSKAVIKSPLAAEIKEAGRSYIMVGNNEIFELFQSAYSGANEDYEISAREKSFDMCAVSFSGKREIIYHKKIQKSESTSKIVVTQNSAVVSYIKEYCESNGIKKLSSICQPSLPKQIFYDEVSVDYGTKDRNMRFSIGIFDDPSQQLQDNYFLDISANTLIVGASQSGKTNLFELAIKSLAERYSPDDITFYILDFASMILKKFEPLNHVGGVAVANEDDKVMNLFKTLLTEISRRRNKFASSGVSSFKAYRESGKRDVPQIVLFIDNIMSLKDIYFKDNDGQLISILNEGTSVGISVIASSMQVSGLGYRYTSIFSEKISFHCNNEDDYISLMGQSKLKLSAVPGRCFVKHDSKVLECQTFMTFKGNTAESIKSFVGLINSKYPNKTSMIIPEVPEKVSSSYVLNQFARVLSGKYNLPCGISYSDVDIYNFNLAKVGLFAILGKNTVNKVGFVKYLIKALSIIYPDKSDIYICDGIEREYSVLKEISEVRKYDVLPDGIKDMFKSVNEKLEERYNKFAAGDDDVLNESSLCVIVINNNDALSIISSDKETLERYKNMRTRYKNMNVCIIVTCADNVPVNGFNSPEILKNIKDTKQAILFDDIENMKMFEVPFQEAKKYKKHISNGDCYVISDTKVDKIKIPT